MTLLEDQSASFIVRIWRERGETEDGPGEWRGSIEHVQTGKRSFFRELRAIERFMAPLLQEIGIDSAQRFWEQMSPEMLEQTGSTPDDTLPVIPPTGSPRRGRSA
ncbi:MAG TPA: hypothetical protein VLC08_01080 [Chitinolyticbacter sp.]|uniref:hypothetical protein n=1 Tax=Chitinolyticbacter albus TaxID=2961951 RepID=UPI00210BA7FC|nr:hypothetical protein [Chitinolyticbacter albus]HSC78921.1 hypothetical protein [Chitinolyticbacter sp.]